MEKQLETWQVELNSSNENVNHMRHTIVLQATKKELDEIVRLETNSKSFKSKVKWTEECETILSVF